MCIRASTVEDAVYLSVRLRETDLREMEALLGCSPLEGLLHGVMNSSPAMSVITEEGLVAVFGVVPEGPGIGRVWMLGTPFLDKHPLRCLKEARRWVSIFIDRYELLWNYADGSNPRQIGWLRLCGFQIVRQNVPVGPGNLPCALFMLSRSGSI